MNKKEEYEEFRRRLKRGNKKDRKWVEQKMAEWRANAENESKDRQEDIDLLWQDLKQSATQLALLVQRVEPISTLAELVRLQKDEIAHLTNYFRKPLALIRQHVPTAIDTAESMEFRELASCLYAQRPRRTSKQEQERKRSLWRFYLPGGVGLVEYEFGGAAEALWKSTLLVGKLEFEPTCLDGILNGQSLNMDGEEEGEEPLTIRKPGLQELFGMDRNRFRKMTLPKIEEGRQTRYNYRAVVRIMGALLSEKSKNSWLSDSNLRIRVLIGIKTRVGKVCQSKQIANAFVRVIDRHLPDSAKK